MTWIIENIWHVIGLITAITTNVVALSVGWVKLNIKVAANTKAVRELKEEVQRDQKELSTEMRRLFTQQNEILQKIASLNAKVEILIDKR